ncbi:MAG: DUF6265 family protein [Candidatus Zixiibacteriota bacterium]
MKKCLSNFIITAILITLAFSLSANDESSMDSNLSLSNFNMLVGHWRGEGLGGVCEETWLPESAGIMLGTFKLMNDDKVSFFEIMTLSLDSVGPAIRVKHFNADMTGWEDKADMVTFRFDSTSNDQLFFGGLIFKKPAPDSLNIGVRFKKSDGTTREEYINCRKVEIK